MIVILDELTPFEFFNHGGIVKLETDEEFRKIFNLKKKYTFFNYKEYIRFFSRLQVIYISKYPENGNLHEYVKSHTKIEALIGVSKYVLDLEYDKVRSYEFANFYYSGELPNNPDVNPRDPFGIKNVCFSLMEETDTRWDEYTKQRLEMGFDDSELWNLDHSIARFILPRLKRFRETTGGYPGCLNSMDEWYDILDQIIEGFELYVNDEKDKKENEEKINNAFELLNEWFSALWW